MATNEVVVTFKADAANFFRVTDAVAARARQVANAPFTNAASNQLTQTIATPIRKANEEVQRITQETARQAIQQQRLMSYATRDRVNFELAEERRLDRERKRMLSDQLTAMRQQDVARPSSVGSRFSVGGAALGAATAVGLYSAASLASSAFDISIDAARANRVLASSAVEAGIAFEDASKKNKAFADSLGLSERQAAQTTGAILRLAGRAGRPQDADRLSKGFADLSAAYGIDPNDIQTLIGSILSGQDEGLNRLGIADPGQLYREYGKQIGKTADQLTQFEKTQAAVNAVMEKSATFTGAAQNRLNSLEGQVASAGAKWDEFTTGLANTFVTSGPVTDFLDTANAALKEMTGNLADVNKQLKEGKTPDQIAAERRSPVLGALAGAITAPLAGAALVYDLINGEGLEAATRKAYESVYGVADRWQRDDAQRIKNQQDLTKKQDEAAKQEANSRKQKIANEQKVTAELQRQTNLKETQTKIDELQKQSIAGITSLMRAGLRDNPIAQIYYDADAALETLRKNTIGLSAQLRSAFADIQVQQNQLALFAGRMDNELNVFGLREQAADFRNPLVLRRAARQADIDFQRSELDRRRGSVNEALWERSLSSGQSMVDEMETKERQKRLDEQLNIVTRGMMNVANPLSPGLFNSGSAGLGLIGGRSYSAGGLTPEQQAIADRKIISLTTNLRPEDLTATQREIAASAREREADRAAAYEEEARNDRKKLLEYEQAIAENTAEIRKNAEKGGKNYLEVLLRDETQAGATAQKNPARPTSRNADDMQLEVRRLQNGL